MATPKKLMQDVASSLARSPDYKQNLLYAQDSMTFYFYDGRFHERYSDDQFQRKISSELFALHPDLNINKKYVVDIIDLMRWFCEKQRPTIDTPYIAFTDCLFNTDDFTFHEFDIEKIAVHLIPIARADIEKGDCPRFKKFLAEILVNREMKTDTELIDLVQEAFGYYLMNTLKIHAMFFFVGEGNNGKSVLLKLLEKLVGEDNCCHKSIEALTTKDFSASGLIGMKLNVCYEEESKYLDSAKFKALVSGDATDVNRKFKEAISFVPKVKYAFASNALPTFKGINKGLLRRINIVPFHKIVRDEDVNLNLGDELLAELPGIMAWVIEGGRRLIANKFKLSKSSALAETREEFILEVSSPCRFFRECYEVDNKEVTSRFEMYGQYQRWCINNGAQALKATGFYREIRTTIPEAKDVLMRVDGKLDRYFNVRPITNSQLEGDVDITMVSESQLRDANGELL